RFPINMIFPDYDVDELFQITISMFENRDYLLTQGSRWKLKNILANHSRNGDENDGNARYSRNLVEKSIRMQALRLVRQASLNRKELQTIEEADLPNNY
ncbi:MAG: hypothetical protein ACM3MK_13590, partial [Chitinophagales bacterium]